MWSRARFDVCDVCFVRAHAECTSICQGRILGGQCTGPEMPSGWMLSNRRVFVALSHGKEPPRSGPRVIFFCAGDTAKLESLYMFPKGETRRDQDHVRRVLPARGKVSELGAEVDAGGLRSRKWLHQVDILRSLWEMDETNKVQNPITNEGQDRAGEGDALKRVTRDKSGGPP